MTENRNDMNDVTRVVESWYMNDEPLFDELRVMALESDGDAGKLARALESAVDESIPPELPDIVAEWVRDASSSVDWSALAGQFIDFFRDSYGYFEEEDSTEEDD